MPPSRDALLECVVATLNVTAAHSRRSQTHLPPSLLRDPGSSPRCTPGSHLKDVLPTECLSFYKAVMKRVAGDSSMLALLLRSEQRSNGVKAGAGLCVE